MTQKTLKAALGALADLPYFFVWRLGEQDATGKFKVKHPWRNGYPFAPLDKATQTRNAHLLEPFDVALARVQSESGDGATYALGCYLMPQDGYWFLDIDANAAEGSAQQAWAQLQGAFFEYSSSGKAVHFIGRWPSPQVHGTRPETGIELYSGLRGVCFGLSGAAWGSADVVMQPPEQWIREALPEVGELPAGRLPGWAGPEDDDELIEKMLGRSESATLLRGGVTFRQLWEGYGVDDDAKSELDASLASQLAWWTGCDQPRMLRLMKRSGRWRDKWHERGDDYLVRTATAACKWHTINNGDKCLGNVPKPVAAPPVAPVPEVIPPGMGVEAAAVAAEFGVQDTQEHRGMAGAQLAIRSAANMDELKAAAVRVGAMQSWDRVDLETLATMMQRKSVELATKLPIKMCRDLLAVDVGPAMVEVGEVGSPDWVKEWCFIKADAKFCHLTRNYLMVTRDTFDLVNATADGVPRKVTTGMPGKPSELWPDWKGENVDAMGFDPREGQFYTKGRSYYCNAFVGTMPERDHAPAPQWAIDAYKQHLLNLCNGCQDTYATVLQWMARLVQRPGDIPRWAIFFIGEEGTGKTMLTDALVAALGPENVRVSGSKAVNNEGGFMDWAAHGKLLGIINDFVVSGRNMYETAEAIKPVISDNLVTITRKGKPDFTYENFAGYMCSANSKSPIPVTKGSRRWYFVRTTQMDEFAVRDATVASDYFAKLVDALGALTPGQWRVFFESVPVAENFPIRAPWSAEMDNVIANNTSEHKLAVLELIGNYKIVSGNQISQAMRGIEGAPTRKGIGKMMQDFGFNAYKERVKIGSTVCTVYVHSSLGNNLEHSVVAAAARKFSEIKDVEKFATLAT